MKYISTILIALCLGWSWKVIHQEPAVSFQTHASLQNKIAEIIASAIEKLKPESDNFQIKTLWTENLPTGQVKAFFSYKFDEVDNNGELINSEIEGEAILEKDPSIAEQLNQPERWTIVNVKTNTGSINFRDGIVITPNTQRDTSSQLNNPSSGFVPSPQSEGTGEEGATAITPQSKETTLKNSETPNFKSETSESVEKTDTATQPMTH